MALWDRVQTMMALAPWAHEPIETRSDPPTEGSLADFIARIQGARDTQWRAASVREALSVPAIFRAVTLISNLTGSLSMQATRNGVELEAAERPRLIIRPDPFTIPREFFRQSAWSLATYGEAWWWVAKRDFDLSPMSLIARHPREYVVTANQDDPRFNIIEWNGKRIRNDESGTDHIQIKMTGEVGALRGAGPLQMCGAAVSVAVEAQEWAANFFAEDGGVPSLIIKSATELGASKDDPTRSEADVLRDQWMSKPHNVPRVIDPGIESVEPFGLNTQGAQMLEARNWQNGDAARMFGIPGPLLEYMTSGSSLTYQNVGQEFVKMLRVCLNPDYLEPIEQTMSDQLTRSTVARFNRVSLEQPDVKTLYEVATLGLEKGVHDREEARAIVGLAPSLENAAVPFSPPAAIPSPAAIEVRATTEEVRCQGMTIRRGLYAKCGKLLGQFAAPYSTICPRCHTVAAA